MLVALGLATSATCLGRPQTSPDASSPAPASAAHKHPGMDMGHSGERASDERDPQAVAGAMDSMSHQHLSMNAHMRMSERRPAAPGDAEKADEVVKTLRASIEKYKDYHAAIADGYRPFLPGVKQPMYHFTNYWHGFLEAFTFDAARPTSLLYRKTSSGYELVGAMYTAPKRWSEEKLNERVPLSVARWHQHVNICLPPRGAGRTADWKAFGPAGSISTEDACHAAGGRWFPILFGWMVHVYPFESDPTKVWAH